MHQTITAGSTTLERIRLLDRRGNEMLACAATSEVPVDELIGALDRGDPNDSPDRACGAGGYR
jgi:hypothetical protein